MRQRNTTLSIHSLNVVYLNQDVHIQKNPLIKMIQVAIIQKSNDKVKEVIIAIDDVIIDNNNDTDKNDNRNCKNIRIKMKVMIKYI